jgi:hypothetical protein|tara:strand:+ start:582 stop:809 length:228 start_codon:yes stop_codon:yes gene_type:complete
MTSLSIKEYNQDIDYKVEKIKAMKKIAKEVTLTEFIEQYPRHNHIILGSFWYSVNGVDFSERIEKLELEKFEGTD